MPLHSFQQRIQRPGADLVTMPPEFGDDPLAVDRPLARVVEDMHLPEAQENLPAGALRLRSCITVSDVGYHNAYLVRVKWPVRSGLAGPNVSPGRQVRAGQAGAGMTGTKKCVYLA